MNETNPLGNPDFLKDLEFIQDQLSTELGRHKSESQARSDANKLPDALASHRAGEINQELAQACLATGATGAAIALVRGDKMVCQATAGPDAPSIGEYLDPRAGLSGFCVQTRQLQQCNDTQTDPRVDAEACRRLGVRSVVVLPLIDGDELFGVFEILSSRPNAFGEGTLNILQILADRVVESRRQNWQATGTVPLRESESFSKKAEEVVPQEKNLSSELSSSFPRRQRISRKNGIRAAILNVLVIASAITLGTLVGWRLGWQKANLGLRASSLPYQANAPSENRRSDVFLGNALQPSSAWTDECGQSAAAGPPSQPSSGELTVCEDGRVIFRLPPSVTSPVRASHTSQRSPSLEAEPARR